jgi:hypothetical protein
MSDGLSGTDGGAYPGHGPRVTHPITHMAWVLTQDERGEGEMTI